MSAAPSETVQTAARPGASVSRAWLRALELTAPIPRQRERVLPAVVDELGHRLGDKPALLSDRECFTYLELAGRARRYARWALAQGVAKGDVVGLLMPNRPEYLAIWLGITRVGGVVALLNTNLAGQSLAHCIQAASAKHLIVAAELADALDTALPHLAAPPQVWIHGGWRGIDEKIESLSAAPLEAGELREITIDDRALYIFTSGTTGMPKAANVSHARVMQWGLWFAGMMDAQPSDRLYNCLPMYHSVGGVLAPGAMLAAGGSLVVRERFSASQFWSDIIRWECTAFQYIGELCRYLLHRPYAENETAHRLRLACGNGLAASVWEAFQQRFRIPQILEFYAATEGGISLFNVQGKPGAIGHIPPYLAHRFAPALVAFDFDKGEPRRDENGFCIRCGVNEPGEAIGKVQNDPASAGSRFEGYTSAAETEKKNPAPCLRSGRRLGTDRRPDAPGREGLLLLRRPHRRHLSLEGRERGYLRGGARALRFRGHPACQRLRSRDSGDRRPRRDGGHRLRRRARSRRAAPASRRAAARLRASAFSSALSAGRVDRHLQICEDRSRPAGIQP